MYETFCEGKSLISPLLFSFLIPFSKLFFDTPFEGRIGQHLALASSVLLSVLYSPDPMWSSHGH